MHNLFLIKRSDSDLNKTYELIKKEAQKQNLEVVELHSEEYDFSQKIRTSNGDLLYRTATDETSVLLEKNIIDGKLTTLYTSNETGINKPDNVTEASIILRNNDLPIIPSIFHISPDKKQLKEYVSFLGGFPLILKAEGGMNGEGIIKIDTFDSLYSLSQFMTRRTIQRMILRKFIHHTKQARIVVLGDRVIGSLEYSNSADFRTNAGDAQHRSRKAITYNSQIQDLAIQAVKSLGYEFGGVDILFDENENQKPYIAEVNFPCAFHITQKITGINIAKKMVGYLIEKSRSTI